MNKFIMIFILLLPCSLFSQNWSSLGSGTNAQVFALCVYNNQLIAGGSFVTAGGVTVNRIARWDGSSWSALGTGMNNVVYALTVYNNELIAGGYFTNAGGTNANYIARWNGSSWQTLGSGTNDYVTSLAVYNNELYVGGAFSTVGGLSSIAFGKWNSTNWIQLTIGINNIVRALCVYNNELIIGGDFNSPYQHVTRWNGTALLDIPYGARGDVLTLTPGTDRVVIGGSFSIAGNQGMNCIAAWTTGSTWIPYFTGMNFLVNTTVFYQNLLIAGGQFTTAGGVVVNRIAKFEGSNWFPINGGMNGQVTALAVYNGDLIAGGNFTFAGATAANNIAKWRDVVGITTLNENIPETFGLNQNYPNPFNPSTKIKFQVSKRSFVNITVYDGTGREISAIVKSEMNPGTYEADWDGFEFSSGIYYYKMAAGNFHEMKKMVLIK